MNVVSEGRAEIWEFELDCDFIDCDLGETGVEVQLECCCVGT